MDTDDRVRAVVRSTLDWRTSRGLTREESVTWLKLQIRMVVPTFPGKVPEAAAELKRLGYIITEVPHGDKTRTYVKEAVAG